MGSLLYALEIPLDDNGQPLGDTLFASTAHAYDTLPEPTRRRIDGLIAVHTFSKRNAKVRQAAGANARVDDRTFEEVTHPVVRPHPVTGRKCLFINEFFTSRILDIPEHESSRLIAELSAHVIREGVIYRHRWRVGDLVMWDNNSTQHLAIGDYALPQRRMMHRTTLKGIPTAQAA
jgi:taurine dioxygenase